MCGRWCDPGASACRRDTTVPHPAEGSVNGWSTHSERPTDGAAATAAAPHEHCSVSDGLALIDHGPYFFK